MVLRNNRRGRRARRRSARLSRPVAVRESGTGRRPGAIMRAVRVMPRVSGVILAGGRSRRMGGSPKALLPFGGRPLIEHIAETLRSVLPDCLVVTNTPELYALLGLPMVGDVFPEGGSLGGIYSGLRARSGRCGPLRGLRHAVPLGTARGPPRRARGRGGRGDPRCRRRAPDASRRLREVVPSGDGATPPGGPAPDRRLPRRRPRPARSGRGRGSGSSIRTSRS